MLQISHDANHFTLLRLLQTQIVQIDYDFLINCTNLK